MIIIQTLSFPKKLLHKFQIDALGSGGDEVCAVLAGTIGNLSGVVEEVRIVRNISSNQSAGFVMHPEDFLKAVEDTTLYDDDAKTTYLGIIHSHYYDRPYPSIMDWYGAAEKGLYHGCYLIYSVVHERTRGFYWNGNEFRKMELII